MPLSANLEACSNKDRLPAPALVYGVNRVGKRRQVTRDPWQPVKLDVVNVPIGKLLRVLDRISPENAQRIIAPAQVEPQVESTRVEPGGQPLHAVREIHAIGGEEPVAIPDLLREIAAASRSGLPARIQLDPSVSRIPQPIGDEGQGC